jgi:flagellar export protein FliJ
MSVKAPWPLLLKLAKADASQWARKAAALRAEFEKIEAQRVGLAQAAPAYNLRPQNGAPIALIRNQLRFKARLDQMLVDLENHGARLTQEREGALERWRAALAKAEGYEKLALAEKKERRDQRDRLDQQALEEIAQTAAFARRDEIDQPADEGSSGGS